MALAVFLSFLRPLEYSSMTRILITQDLGAVDAREVRHIRGGALQRNAALGGVGHGVLLGVDGGLLVAVAHARGVRGAGQEAVVAGGDDAVGVLAGRNDDAADMQALARGTRAQERGGGHEVRIPTGTRPTRHEGFHGGDKILRFGA